MTVTSCQVHATKYLTVCHFKKRANFLKKHGLYIVHGFFKKMGPKSLPIFITFSDTY